MTLSDAIVHFIVLETYNIVPSRYPTMFLASDFRLQAGSYESYVESKMRSASAKGVKAGGSKGVQLKWDATLLGGRIELVSKDLAGDR